MADLSSKTVFLAGSTGLVGSSIMQYMLNNYPETRIRAASYKHTEPFFCDRRIEYVSGDLRSAEDCRRMVRGCDCALMAAANTGGSYQLATEPWKQVNDNAIMNSQMLEAFHFENVKRVVYIGSATLYQECPTPVKEERLNLSRDPPPAYLGIGWVVRYIEKLCSFWRNQSNMEILMARAANVFGPYAKFNPLTSNFIPALIRKAVDKMDPFEVWGSPDVTRDVVYSEDFARAVVMMLDRNDIEFDTFNVGSGQRTTVGEVIKWILEAAGHKPSEIRYCPDKPTTIQSRALDCSKIRKTLGWEPEYTIEAGISKTTEWWIQNKGWWKR